MRLRKLGCLVLLATCVGALTCGISAAQTVEARREDPKVIRVLTPGRFEAVITKRQGFGEWYDLKNDPEKKQDLGSVNEANGFLWTKTSPEGKRGSWYANPPEKMEILEAGPTRVRVRLTGQHNSYGGAGKPWKELGYEQTFTIYPTGDVYVDYALVTEKPIRLHHFNLILRTTGRWGKQHKGKGGGEVRCASQAGDAPPAKEGSSFVLQWTDGPTYFQDILMVMHKGEYQRSYWNEGFKDLDYRTGFGILGRWPDKTVPEGKDHIRVLLRFADDINGAKAALPYANDYRSPDKLDVTKGTLDKSDEGDRDNDGFNEEEGCYVLRAAAGGVAFTLHGKETPRMTPAFKVKNWKAQAPGTITLDGKALTAKKGFTAAVSKRILVFQLLRDVKEDVKIDVPQNR